MCIWSMCGTNVFKNVNLVGHIALLADYLSVVIGLWLLVSRFLHSHHHSHLHYQKYREGLSVFRYFSI